MKQLLLMIVLASLRGVAIAEIRYVSLDGGHVEPFTNRVSAATNLSSAVQLASAGDTILVSAGHYRLAAEVTVTNEIELVGVDGAPRTIVDGQGNSRVFNLGDSSCVLRGLTITNGFTTGDGGGVLCATDTPLVEDCRIVGNTAVNRGGGMSYGTAERCLIQGNAATTGNGWGGGRHQGVTRNSLVIGNTARAYGGGIIYGEVVNCTVVSNRAEVGEGGGVRWATVDNSIIWRNTAGFRGNNYSEGAISHSSASELTPGANGNSNLEPMFNLAHPLDFSVPTDQPTVDAGDEVVLAGALDFAGEPRVRYGGVDMGAFEAFTTTHFVSTNGASIAPYGTLASAATELQTAIDFASSNHHVRVAAGTYALSEPLEMDTPITLESMRGPEETIIDGGFSTQGVRFFADAGEIRGFTFQQCVNEGGEGGAVWCSGHDVVLSNCVFLSNQALDGGAVYGGTAKHCLFQYNQATYGGAMFRGRAYDSSFIANYGSAGGSTWYTFVDRCVSQGHFHGNQYGVHAGSVIQNSLLVGNATTVLFSLTAYNCTIVGNHVSYRPLMLGCTVRQSILDGNYSEGAESSSVYNSCVNDINGYSGDRNLYADPLFANTPHAYSLSEDSPCVNAASGSVVGFYDLRVPTA